MSLENISHEEIENMSLIELAKLVLLTEKRPMKFNETFEKVCELKGLTETQKQDKIGQFYTDLNIDGSFVMSGANTWGLKRWYRVQKEESAAAAIPRRKSSQEIDVDEIDVDTDEFDMLDESIDSIDHDELDDDLDGDFEDDDLDVDFDDEDDSDMYDEEN